MMGIRIEILLYVSFLAKDLMQYGSIFLIGDEDIKKGNVVMNLNLQGELYKFGLVTKMIFKDIKLFTTIRPNNKGIVNVPFPNLRKKRSRGNGFSLKILHENISHNGGERRTYSYSTCLLINNILKAKESRF